MSYTLYRDITKVNRTVMTNKQNKYIVIHYTGNRTDLAKSNANYFRSIKRGASAHYFVDKTSVYQVVEDKDAAWAVGKNYGKNNLFNVVKNANSISIEMCSNNGAIAEETFQNTVELTKTLMKKYNIPASNVYRHLDVASKRCPGWPGWYESNPVYWNRFKTAISSSAPVSQPTLKPSVSTNAYTFKDFVKDVQRAIGVSVDGIPGPKTLAATPTVSAKKNRRHAVVRYIQKYLNSIGYDCGAADGIAGSKFKIGTIKFQRANGCVADGEVTARGKTWKKLLKLG